MRTGLRLLVSVTAVLMLTTVLAGTAAADPPEAGTVVTFEIEAGALEITAPPVGDLGAAGVSGTVTNSLGAVTVTDERAAADASWTATVTSTDFVTGGASDIETVFATQATYASGQFISTQGAGTFTPGQPTVPGGQPLDNSTPLTASTHTGGSGGNNATWNPTLSVSFPRPNVAGLYTGTVTHSLT